MKRLHRYFDCLRPPLHISHRGGSALMPENTLPAFRQATERYRTDVLEMDVWSTADGHLAVFHDSTLERCTDGQGPVNQRTLAELKRLDAGHRFSPDGGRTFPWRGRNVRIPTLEEVLAAFPGARFNIEVKDDRPGIEASFARTLTQLGAADRVCLGAEDDRLASRLFEALPDGCHFYPREAAASFVIGVRSESMPEGDDRFSVLDLPYFYEGERMIDRRLVDAAAQASKWLNVWTLDRKEDVDEALALGVGGVMTDRPDILAESIDRYRRARDPV